ncbi:MAG: efflux RND transporter permease subunit [Proteobacteria bacterium]|nr:efflux RND transporter permease subunit [Pseudomonadota bacterium]
MNVKVFIDRPLLSIVINIMLVSLGILAFFSLPVEKYPDIAPPTVYLWASYPGASADAVQKTVVAPLEQAINGVDNMTYMKSSAENGSASISIHFKQGTNTDIAAVNVQNRVVQAQAMLPSEVLQTGVSVEKQQPGQLRILALESPDGTYDESFLTNYFYNYLRPAILRIPGVGKVEIWGGQYALRIWLKPDEMARYGIVPSDITTMLAEQNLEASLGTLGENSKNVFQYTLRYSGRKQDVSEFENLILVSKSTGELLTLKDVADIELGQSDYAYSNIINGHPGVMGSISQVSGSNATRINQDIDKLIDELEAQMPKDIRVVTFDNTNDFLFASIHEVILTLLLAILLVLIVVYFFLQDLRATLIPALGIAISLIGTFAFMAVANYSINMLTLFALVLVIGTVVDNSIVVVEAVQARFDAGYKSSYNASVDAMSRLTSALFTTTLVFMVIFIPVSFMSGTTGIFYRQFGLTMAVAVGISLLVSLTVSPALASIILKPNDEEQRSLSFRMRKIYQFVFHAILKRYTRLVKGCIRHKWISGLSVLVALIAMIGLSQMISTGFIPDEDTGALMVDISAPTGYTMAKTEKIMVHATDRIQEIPGVESVGRTVGIGGSNKGMIQVQLLPWDERNDPEMTSWKILDNINQILSEDTESQSFAMSMGMIDGYGGGDIELSIQNRNDVDIHTFSEVVQKFIDSLNTRPEITDARTGFESNNPQYRVDVDVVRCKKYGVLPSAVLSELGAFLGSEYISSFNKYNQIYQVTMQLRAEDRASEASLNRLYIRSESGEMLPISQFVKLTKEYMPQALSSFNMINSIGVSGSVAQGSSSGDAIRAIREVAAKDLPVGYTIEFDGITREEIESGSNTIMIFSICIFFVYLVLVALYESLFIPLAVMISVPFGLAGGFLFAWLFDIENNIYFQVGLIMLIGLLAKTAILLTEYASQCRQAGMTVSHAAWFAARMRLRPILMTALTMVFGMLPLMFASGVGANGRRTIGTGAVGGMLVGTLGLLFIVPVLFVIFQRMQERFKPNVAIQVEDPLILAELQSIEDNEDV